MTVLSGATLLETTSCTAQSPSLPPLTGVYQGQPTLPLSQLHSNTQIDPSKDIDPGLIRWEPNSILCCLVAKLCPTLLQLPFPCLDFPGKHTGLGCHLLLQGSFPTQDQTRLLHWQVGSGSHQGSPMRYYCSPKPRNWNCHAHLLNIRLRPGGVNNGTQGSTAASTSSPAPSSPQHQQPTKRRAGEQVRAREDRPPGVHHAWPCCSRCQLSSSPTVVWFPRWDWCWCVMHTHTLKEEKVYDWDFPGGPVVKTLCSQCRGHSFDPWSWN